MWVRRSAPGLPMSGIRTVSSTPRMPPMPSVAQAVPKRTTPPISSWSVMARAGYPSSAARSASDSGSEAPSRRERAEWQ